MRHAIYHDLVPWYRLLDPPEEHREEAEVYQAALLRTMSPPETASRPRLLELGSGAGHNALWLKAHFDCTLVDLSEPMLGLSRSLNPQCQHVQGDMRTARLERTFDALLIHDAIVYMCSEEDLLAALATAYEHLRPGGAAIFAPDCVRESFVEGIELNEADDGDRAMRCMYWTWDSDPDGCTYSVEYALLLRESGTVQALHDHHQEGLFSISQWQRLLQQTGFTVTLQPRPMEEAEDPDSYQGYFDQVFLCQRPL
ncbi:MAG: methyltransferase domain-containing protein [Pseudomonadales bacterium]